MVGDTNARRVLVLFETPWDRRQLAACAQRWSPGIEVAFSEPSDPDCPASLDPLEFAARAVRGDLGRIDGVLSSSDYPGAILAGAIATQLGLPGSRPQCLIGASHKYYSRIAQRAAAPHAVPDFAVVDPRRPEPPPLPFPCFVKPVKSSYSVLARRVDGPAEFREFLSSAPVKEFGDGYMAIFNQLVAAYTTYEADGHAFIVEELLRGDLVTVEGFVCGGVAEIFGIVDSTLHPNRSFAHFDYPSALPDAVQERMASIARDVVAELGLDQILFNIEMMYDRAEDRIAIVEVNPRICGQFADLYQKVDGLHTYEIALALCTGARPELKRRSGRYAAAASYPLRVFEPSVVEAAPGEADVAAAEALYPETIVWSECRAGEELADFDLHEDGASHRYAVINLGGESRQDVARRACAVQDRLGYRLRPSRPAA